MNCGVATCRHLPLLDSAWTEDDRSNSNLCSICDTMYCWRPECASEHRHEKRSVFALVDSAGFGPQEGGAIIGLVLAARCGRTAMTEADFVETAKIVWNWEINR